MSVSATLSSANDYFTARRFSINLCSVIPVLLLTGIASAQSLNIESNSSLSASKSPLTAENLKSITESEKSEPWEFFMEMDETLGPWDKALIKPLQELGSFQQRDGQHQEAIGTLSYVWHLTRINYGLYHESQIPLLEAMIESESRLRDWEAVNNHYLYMEHLYSKLYALDDLRLERGLQKVSAWHVSALNINLDGKRMEHLQHANKLFRLRLHIAELTLSEGDPKFELLYRNIERSEQAMYISSDFNREYQRRRQQRIQSNSYVRTD